MSFLFSHKKSSCLLALLVLAGCQNIRTREDIHRGTQPAPGQQPSHNQQTPQTVSGYNQTPQQPTPLPPEVENPPSEVPQISPAAPPLPAIPKIGIILGGGGAKAYAHIGFLHELARAKVPVQSIGGIEFAAPMAALYANKEQANDVEWQMFKLKDDEVLKKSLLGSVHKNNEVSVLKDFIGTAFGRSKTEDFRISYACPSWNIKKNQVYLMNRGSIEQVLYYCMAYPPFFKPYQGYVSAIRDVTALANYLRSRGANYIVFVNVLQPPGGHAYTLDASATDNVLWSEIAGLYNRPLPGVDTVISLDTSDYGIMDFDKRREIMNKGAESAARQLKSFTRKWGL